MAIRALIFDLDGLLLDTETTDYEAWAWTYREHGVELPLDRWQGAIGSDSSTFHPLEHLKAQVPGVDEAALQATRRSYRDGLIHRLPPNPGVIDRLDEAEARGLRLAVASSSEREWVEGHLERIGIHQRFETLRCKEDVERVKPDPALFRSAAEAVGVAPDEAVAFEDSPNGVTAAVAAGLRCVAVPGPMTRGLRFDHAHLRLDSLAECSLEEILARVGA